MSLPRRVLARLRSGGLTGLTRATLQHVARETFEFWEHLGIHVTPVHFYQPIPDTRTLDERLWDHESALCGVDMNESAQLDRLDRYESAYRDEYAQFPLRPDFDEDQVYLQNEYFESVDAEIYYSVLRDLEPTTLIEVGGGFSTRVALAALAENDRECSVTVIEPYPGEYLRRRAAERDLHLLERDVQDVPVTTFEQLSGGDVLFIDSSHVLTIGSDVQYEYLEVLPRLSADVHVHVHDIYFPGNYPEAWVTRRHWFWNEQYVLQAFLAFNQSFEVLWSSSYLDHYHPERLEAAFPAYDRNRRQAREPVHAVPPGSFWMRRT